VAPATDHRQEWDVTECGLLHPGTSHVTGVATTVGNTDEAPNVCNGDGSEHRATGPTPSWGGDPEALWSQL